MDSIVEARSELEDKLSPALRRELDERLSRLYAGARKQAALQLQDHGEREAALSLPPECPYTIDQVLAEDWYPDSPSGEAG